MLKKYILTMLLDTPHLWKSLSVFSMNENRGILFVRRRHCRLEVGLWGRGGLPGIPRHPNATCQMPLRSLKRKTHLDSTVFPPGTNVVVMFVRIISSSQARSCQGWRQALVFQLLTAAARHALHARLSTQVCVVASYVYARTGTIRFTSSLAPWKPRDRGQNHCRLVISTSYMRAA